LRKASAVCMHKARRHFRPSGCYILSNLHLCTGAGSFLCIF
jgi:hypothetical protein